MSDSPSDQQYVRVVCPVCGTRIVELASSQPQTVKCPDCFTKVPVPPSRKLPSQTTRVARPEVGTYRIQQANDSNSSPAADARRQARRERAMVLVICPICATRIDTLARKEPRMVKCPDCHEPVRIPSQQEVDEKRRKTPRGRSVSTVEALPVPAPSARPRPAPSFVADAMSTIRREEESPPPKWTFFSRVFSVPWHEEVLSRWVYLSIGLLVMNGLMAFLIEQGLQMAGSQFGMVTAFFVLPLIWIGTWTISYAVACSRAILEDTASGSDRISNWHESNWREWVLVLAAAAFLASVAIIIGYFAGKLVVWAGGPFLPTVIGTAWIVFPYIVLSALETNSLLTPFSVPILRSLWKHGWAGILFILLSTAITLGPVAVMVFADSMSLMFRAAVASPLIAAAVFINARLLGRLGWLITRDE